MEDNKVPLSWSWVGEGRGLLLEDSSGGANYAVGESRCRQWSWGVSQQVVGCGRFLHLQNKLKLQVFFIMLFIGFKEIFELCMHFYIVILYLSQLDLHATLNAASRMYLLKSWGQCNASFVTFYVN